MIDLQWWILFISLLVFIPLLIAGLRWQEKESLREHQDKRKRKD